MAATARPLRQGTRPFLQPKPDEKEATMFAIVKTLRPSRLVLVGVVGLVAAGSAAAAGLISRARTTQDLVQWTNAQAVPTVALAQLQHGDANRTLTLPG